jgi:Lar family restriction alleviation protein
MPELKPCPFCGNKDQDAFICDGRVICYKCGAIGPLKKTKEAAIAAWNNRIKEEDGL